MQEHDEFSGSSHSKYSPDLIFSSAGDIDHPKYLSTSKGKFDRTKVRVPSQLWLMVTKIMSDLGGVYESQADFVRDAVYHRAMYWLENDRLHDPSEPVVRRNLAMASLQAHMSRQKEYETLYDTLRDCIQTTHSPQDRLEYQLEADHLADTISNEWWANKFRQLAQ